jgi:hypothetical protein
MVARVRSRQPNLALHAFGLRTAFPTSTIHLGGGRLTWIGAVQPTVLSQTYTIKIEYAGRGRPVITVLSPTLKKPEGEDLPHVFPGDELCLHFPGEWEPNMSMATTIVPWASEWLFFYEVWLATGIWTGGGHGSDDGDKRDSG